MVFEQINVGAVLLAAVVKFILGGCWYSSVLFGNLWLREVGQSKDTLVASPRPLLLAAGLSLVTAFTLAIIISLADLDFMKSVALGCLMGVGILAAMVGPQFAFEGRSFRLYVIYAGEYVVTLAVMAAIIGGWR